MTEVILRLRWQVPLLLEHADMWPKAIVNYAAATAEVPSAPQTDALKNPVVNEPKTLWQAIP